MRLCTIFCGLLLAVANVHAEERQVSLDWLKTVAFAAHQTDYSGVFVYQYDNRVETSRITHVVESDSEYEKLESLDGPKREIIRHHGQVWCYINHKMVQVGSQQGRSRFPSLLPDQLSALSANYQVKEGGAERVAGYNTHAILFQPKDNSRYVHKIWVHTDSGLLLKAAVLGEKNQLVEQYAFTQLQIGGNIDSSWVKSSASALPAPEAVKSGVAVNSGWIVDALPAGFKKTMEIQRPMRGKHAPVTQLVFSDGLSAISIFIEPIDSDEDDVEGLSSRGAVNLYHKLVDRNLITVVGEVPPRTVMQVLDSLRYNGK
ncbi:sugar dehydratase [Ferrigenium kumadai]|uniref:Sugar dehydratase n=1 Tax=Ferrigenium kumadai TaxID=1682490 RepID=A0AAN1SZ18_9PROT|nr:MucB/RseB C-terminal domain-containing protein [Ferrigenium kumadai]BBI99286.1 sugar dehydratase [Ferrigenium kumadai]